ncbi:MAG TPA: hypothetical protein VLG49_06180 [Rhabdochlamydiaceae bacterium]|nr:hypothetical protein [Rhabdochlamydiaceae bacterium]
MTSAAYSFYHSGVSVPSVPRYAHSNGHTSASFRIKNLKNIIFKDFNLIESHPSAPSFSTAFKTSQETIRDVSGLFRVITSKCNLLQNAPSSSTLGAPHLFNVFWGVDGIKTAFHKIKNSLRVRDAREAFKAAVDIVTNCLVAASGVADTAYRGFKLAEMIEKAKYASDLMAPLSRNEQRAFNCQILSTLFSGGIFLILALVEGYNIYDEDKFLSLLDKQFDRKKLTSSDLKVRSQELQKGLLFLESQLKTAMYSSVFDSRKIDAAEKELEARYLKQYGKKLFPDEAKKTVRRQIKEKFYREALLEGIHGLKTLISDLEMPALTSQKCEEVVKRLFSREELIEKGHEMRLHKIEIKTEVRLGKHVGEKCLKIIKETFAPNAQRPNLAERITSVDPHIQNDATKEAQSLLDKVRSFSKGKLVVDAIILTCAAVALAAICAFPLLGVPMIATTFVFIAISMVFVGVDIKHLHDDLSADQLEKYDKRLLIVSSAICLVSMGISVALTFALAFSPVSLLFLAVGVMWLGMNAYTWHVLKKHEFKYQQEHPTVACFDKIVHSKRVESEQVKRVFSKLPREDQNGIKHAIWKKHVKQGGGKLIDPEDLKLDEGHDFGTAFFNLYPTHEDVKFAVQKRLQKIEKIRLEQLEKDKLHKAALKDMLMPLICAENLK